MPDRIIITALTILNSMVFGYILTVLADILPPLPSLATAGFILNSVPSIP